MKKLSLLSLLAISSLAFAQGGGPSLPSAPGSGAEPAPPIDANAIILIIAAAVLILGVVAYRKLSLKKA